MSLDRPTGRPAFEYLFLSGGTALASCAIFWAVFSFPALPAPSALVGIQGLATDFQILPPIGRHGRPSTSFLIQGQAGRFTSFAMTQVPADWKISPPTVRVWVPGPGSAPPSGARRTFGFWANGQEMLAPEDELAKANELTTWMVVLGTACGFLSLVFLTIFRVKASDWRIEPIGATH